MKVTVKVVHAHCLKSQVVLQGLFLKKEKKGSLLPCFAVSLSLKGSTFFFCNFFWCFLHVSDKYVYVAISCFFKFSTYPVAPHQENKNLVFFYPEANTRARAHTFSLSPLIPPSQSHQNHNFD